LYYYDLAVTNSCPIERTKICIYQLLEKHLRVGSNVIQVSDVLFDPHDMERACARDK
jgi:hypothetical protein